MKIGFNLLILCLVIVFSISVFFIEDKLCFIFIVDSSHSPIFP